MPPSLTPRRSLGALAFVVAVVGVGWGTQVYLGPSGEIQQQQLTGLVVTQGGCRVSGVPRKIGKEHESVYFRLEASGAGALPAGCKIQVKTADGPPIVYTDVGINCGGACPTDVGAKFQILNRQDNGGYYIKDLTDPAGVVPVEGRLNTFYLYDGTNRQEITFRTLPIPADDIDLPGAGAAGTTDPGDAPLGIAPGTRGGGYFCDKTDKVCKPEKTFKTLNERTGATAIAKGFLRTGKDGNDSDPVQAKATCEDLCGSESEVCCIPDLGGAGVGKRKTMNLKDRDNINPQGIPYCRQKAGVALATVDPVSMPSGMTQAQFDALQIGTNNCNAPAICKPAAATRDAAICVSASDQPAPTRLQDGFYYRAPEKNDALGIPEGRTSMRFCNDNCGFFYCVFTGGPSNPNFRECVNTPIALNDKATGAKGVAAFTGTKKLDAAQVCKKTGANMGIAQIFSYTTGAAAAKFLLPPYCETVPAAEVQKAIDANDPVAIAQLLYGSRADMSRATPRPDFSDGAYSTLANCNLACSAVGVGGVRPGGQPGGGNPSGGQGGMPGGGMPGGARTPPGGGGGGAAGPRVPPDTFPGNQGGPRTNGTSPSPSTSPSPRGPSPSPSPSPAPAPRTTTSSKASAASSRTSAGNSSGRSSAGNSSGKSSAGNSSGRSSAGSSGSSKTSSAAPGCIEVIKQAKDGGNKPVSPVPPFTFILDNNPSIRVTTDPTGSAFFNGVSAPGVHTVTEVLEGGSVQSSPTLNVQAQIVDPTPNSFDLEASLTFAPQFEPLSDKDLPEYFSVRNIGVDTAAGVTMTQTIPAGFTFNQALTDAACTAAANTVTCDAGTLDPGESRSFLVYLDMPTTLACNSTLTMTAQAQGSPDLDANKANNTSTASALITCPGSSPSVSSAAASSAAGSVSGTSGWILDSVNPAGGRVNVTPGTNCAKVTFVNRQPAVSSVSSRSSSSTGPGCIRVVKQAKDGSNKAVSPIPPFTFVLDNSSVKVTTDSTGTAFFQGVTLGSHTVTEILENGTSSVAGNPLKATLSFAPQFEPQSDKDLPETFAASNIGTTVLNDVVITQEVPSGYTFNAALTDNACTLVGSTVTCAVGTLNPGASRSFLVYLDMPVTLACNSTMTMTITARGANTANVSQVTSTASTSALITCPNTPTNGTISSQSASVVSNPSAPVTWILESVNPAGGKVDVKAGSSCVTVTFVNKQPSVSSSSKGSSRSSASSKSSTASSGSGCVRVVKVAKTGSQNTTPVPPFTFVMDGKKIINDGTGNAFFDAIKPGAHTVAEESLDGWNLTTINPAGGRIEVKPGDSCVTVTFTNERPGSSSSSRSSGASSSSSRSSSSSSRSSSYASSYASSSLGCITVTKQAKNAAGQPISPVPGFTYILDNGRSTDSNSAGVAFFRDVSAGQHSVTEVQQDGWNFVSVNPASGIVNVTPGGNCAGITFVNQQPGGSSSSRFSYASVSSGGPGCIRVVKQVKNSAGQTLAPVPGFTFTLDGVVKTTNENNGTAFFQNITPGKHTVTETPLDGWPLVSVNPSGGLVSVVSGGNCTTVTFVNQQPAVSSSSYRSSAAYLSSAAASSLRPVCEVYPQLCASSSGGVNSCIKNACDVGGFAICRAQGKDCTNTPGSGFPCFTCAGVARSSAAGFSSGAGYSSAISPLCIQFPQLCQGNSSSAVKPAQCGNGVREQGEACDDGNRVDTDSCSNDCRRGVNEQCDQHLQCVTDVCKNGTCTTCQTGADCASGICDSGRCAILCGNGKLDAAEQCDDGNRNNDDACTNSCKRNIGMQCYDSRDCATNRCDGGSCNICTSDSQCVTQKCLPNGDCADFCGNGTVDPGEACDDGNVSNTDACTNDCRLGVGLACSASESCGSHLCQNGKCTACTSDLQCPGRMCVNGTCSNLCGNGVKDAGEACDDGNISDNDGCSNRCKLGDGLSCGADTQCASNLCKNGLCIPCNASNACPSGSMCQNGRCTEPAVHGNGIVEPGEACDDGNQDDNDGCSNDGRIGVGGRCSDNRECVTDLCRGNFCAACTENGQCASNQCVNGRCTLRCGNGQVDSGEACDDKNVNNADACSNACLLGNGQDCQQSPQCDSGLCRSNICQPCNDTSECPSGLYCLARQCKAAPQCGNGKREFTEMCDDGNTVDGDGCGMHCKLSNGERCINNGQCESRRCDQGICKACDSNDQCASNQCINGVCADLCGNGTVDAGEECDDAGRNSDILPDHCRMDCRLPHMGDGVRDRNEQCDDGNVVSGDGCDRFGRLEVGGQVAGLGNDLTALIARGRPPAGQTGPGAVVAMAAGAAVGWYWLRRRRYASA